jgi:hypothetical protein
MITCRTCKKEIASGAKVCPHCGVKTPNLESFKLKHYGLGAAFAALGLFGFGQGLFQHRENFGFYVVPAIALFIAWGALYQAIKGKDMDGD